MSAESKAREVASRRTPYAPGVEVGGKTVRPSPHPDPTHGRRPAHRWPSWDNQVAAVLGAEREARRWATGVAPGRIAGLVEARVEEAWREATSNDD